MSGPAAATRQPITLAVVQCRSFAGDLDGAVAEHVARITEAADAGASVVLFPELSLSGYEPELIDLHGIRIEPGDPALAPILRECARRSVHALVGAPVSLPGDGGGLPAIGVVHITPEGRAGVVYRKQNLDMAEIGIFAAGSAAAVLQIHGWRLALAAHRDAAVPTHVAAAVTAHADAYLISGLFLIGAEQRIEEQMAAVTSNGLWAALAQYSGGTGAGPACGGSGVWRPDGTPAVRLASAPAVGVTELA